MDTQVLIDSIMRQTTVLIAHLSSAAGLRAPLAHLADEVFLHLSQELEQQGVSRKIVADMFGLALRGYQRRVQRLRESATDRGATLWQALLEFLQEQGPVSRRRVFERFRYDDAAAVGAVLNDLATNGLVYRTGNGNGNETIYELTGEQARATFARESGLETASLLVLLELCKNPECSPEELATRLALTSDQVEASVARLEREGRLRRNGSRFETDPLIVPVGAEVGWEAAVFDHFQTVCVAIATKLRQGHARSTREDTTGGATLSFEIDDAHPNRDEVLGLLQRVRAQANELWHRVEEHNARHRGAPVPTCLDRPRRVSFYVGQVEMPSEDEA